MDIDIRGVEPDQFEELMRVHSHAFGQHPDPKEVEKERLVFEVERALGAFERGAMIGGVLGASLRLTVPGGELPTAGVTSVGVLPTHRRRGIMTALVRRQLDDLRERGEPLAALYTSEGPIYGRFGYGLATLMGVLEIERPHTAFDVEHEPREIRLLPRAEALAAFPPVHDRVRPGRPGFVARNGAWWEYRVRDIEQEEFGFGQPFFALCEGPGGPEGYAIYTTKHDWSQGKPNGTLDVVELIAETPDAHAALWRYCLDVDLMARVQAWLRPVDEPLLHLLADPRRLSFRLRDALWLRVVDVPAALAGRRYAAEGRLVVEVRDLFCPWNDGRYALEGGPDGAACGATDADPDLTVSAADLGAIYLGGVSADALRRAGRVGGDPESVRRADAMFAWQPAPWCPQFF